MNSRVLLGRTVAAIGIGCAFVAIWTNALQGKYWDDGTFGGLLLILAILAALLLLGAVATDRVVFDIALGAVGGIILGMYLWFPALFAFDQWDQLDSGAWIGVCSALIILGAAIAIGPGLLAAGLRPFPAGVLVAVAGLALVLVGIWTKTADGFDKYWNAPGLGHSLGIAMLILVVLTALALAAAFAGTLNQDVALGFAAVTMGLTITYPVVVAFDNLGHLKIGGWLAGIGGILAVVGAVAMRQLAPARAPAAETPPAAPTPPPA